MRPGCRTNPAGGGPAQRPPRGGQRPWRRGGGGGPPGGAALADHSRRRKTRHKDLFEGISGYVAEEPDRARLLIGPFKDRSDANIFVQDLESLNVSAFGWTSRPG